MPFSETGQRKTPNNFHTKIPLKILSNYPLIFPSNNLPILPLLTTFAPEMISLVNAQQNKKWGKESKRSAEERKQKENITFQAKNQNFAFSTCPSFQSWNLTPAGLSIDLQTMFWAEWVLYFGYTMTRKRLD